MKDLINWKELSRILAGNEDSIRRNKIPKKYEKQVESFILCITKWKASVISNKVIKESIKKHKK